MGDGAAYIVDQDYEYSPEWNDWFLKGKVPPHPSASTSCPLMTRKGNRCAAPKTEVGVCVGHARSVAAVVAGLLGGAR